MTAKISQVKQLMLSLWRDDRACRLPVIVKGSPGLGKSFLVEQVAQEMGARFQCFLTATMDPTDVCGCPNTDGSYTHFKPPYEFLRLTDHPDFEEEAGTPVVVNFDDLPATREENFNALLRIMQQREVGNYKIRDNVYFAATGNRAKDQAGAAEITTALSNRFIHIELQTDVDEWVEWAYNHKINPLMIGFVQKCKIQVLDQFDPSEERHTFASPRSVANASFIVDAVGLNKDDRFILQNALSGCCGDGWATEFLGFADNRNLIVPAEEIVKDPKKCRVPKKGEIDACYATNSALISYIFDKTTQENVIAAVIYASRQNDTELGAVLARDVLRKILAKQPHNFKTKVFSNKDFGEATKTYKPYLAGMNEK